MNDELRSPLRCQGGRGRVASHKLLADSIGTTGELPSELATRLAPLTVSTPGHPAALSQQTLTTVVLATLEQTQRHHHHRLSLTQVTHICRLQASLVSIIFAGLALYTLVLVVSLFRIFIKVPPSPSCVLFSFFSLLTFAFLVHRIIRCLGSIDISDSLFSSSRISM